MKRQFIHTYKDIISLDNLLSAYTEFIQGKKHKADVLLFSLHLIDNIIQLHTSLANFTYQHSGYEAFNISDPKPRNIHKAQVKDRLLHHAIYRQLYPFFDHTFTQDSYSCRNNKGTHKAINKFKSYSLKVSQNNTKTCYVLKCDIQKFFANIDHNILKDILSQYIKDQNILWLLSKVIDSFETSSNKGLPLGNLTSQLFINIYMNEFDQYVKHKLKQKYYIRYADDFVFLSQSKEDLLKLLPQIKNFLGKKLQLSLHPKKVSLTTLASGVDYLGYVNFPNYRVLRTKTKQRMLKKVNNKNLPSYLGLLQHGNNYNLENTILNKIALQEQ
ncbi:group II intron reverse transcriptase domain-containing protein [Candidatus Nomurabacteria bacterium]|nr:group II intron reverse transcriptase domain-containing protein [Candidatus Nomurabacteria bacterium]